MRRRIWWSSGGVVLSLLASGCGDDASLFGANSASSDAGPTLPESTATPTATETATLQSFDPSPGAPAHSSLDAGISSDATAESSVGSGLGATSNARESGSGKGGYEAPSSSTSMDPTQPDSSEPRDGQTHGATESETDAQIGNATHDETHDETHNETHGATDGQIAGETQGQTHSVALSSTAGSGDTFPTAPIYDGPCEEAPYPPGNSVDSAIVDAGAIDAGPSLPPAPRPDWEFLETSGASPIAYVSAGLGGTLHAVVWGYASTSQVLTWDVSGDVANEYALRQFETALSIDPYGNVFTSYLDGTQRHIYEHGPSGAVTWDIVEDSLSPGEMRSFGGRVYVSGGRWRENSYGQRAKLIALNTSGQKLWENEFDVEGLFFASAVAASCDYVAMSGNAGYLSSSEDMDLAAALYTSNGDLVWQAHLNADAPGGWGTLSDIIVDDDGTVLISGAYGDNAFVQKRDLAGDVVWHRTFAELPLWKTIAWTGKGKFMVAGAARTAVGGAAGASAILVRELDMDGRDRWSREITGISEVVLNDAAIDQKGNIYLAGSTGLEGLLVRVNAAQFTDIDADSDGGIPAIDYSDPDDVVQSTSGQWCKYPVSVAAVNGAHRGFDPTEGGSVDRIVLDEFEHYTLCPGETHGSCTLDTDGDLVTNTWSSHGPHVFTSGCMFTVYWSYHNPSAYGCCRDAGETLLKVDACTPEFEGRRCQPKDAPCYDEGVCRDAACVPTTPIECDDGQYCNGEEWCDESSGCRTGFSPAFDDDPATIDSCDESTDAVTHAPGMTEDLCATPVEVQIGRVSENPANLRPVLPYLNTAELGCGASVDDCRRTENGEWYVASALGDPLSLPVSAGCAEYTAQIPALDRGSVYTQHNVTRCCVGQAPFVDGEKVGVNTLSVP